MNWFLDLLRNLLDLLWPRQKSTGVLPIASGGDEVLTPSITMNGDWLPYLSKPYESQFITFDQLNCVTQSGIHCIEAILNYFYQNKLFPIPEMYTLIEKGGFLNDQGYIELSVRYTAKMAGTTKQGLAMDDFWKAINFWGAVPKRTWERPWALDWEQYYADVPLEVKVAGQEFAKIFQWNWKVIYNDRFSSPDLKQVGELLTHSPLHFAGPLCTRENGVMTYCGSRVYQHAQCLYKLDEFQEDLNQYSPFLQKTELAYPLPCLIAMSLRVS